VEGKKLSDVACSAKYPEVKRPASDREGWRASTRRGIIIIIIAFISGSNAAWPIA